MNRLAAFAIIALLALPAAAQAAPNVDVAFGNTVLIVDPDGRWTGLSRRGLALAGKWTVKGDKVCISQSKPLLPGSLCNRMPAQVGATVAAKDPGGKPITLKLVKGRIKG